MQNSDMSFSPFSIFHISTALVEVPQRLSKARQPRYNNRDSVCGFVTVRVCACVPL